MRINLAKLQGFIGSLKQFNTHLSGDWGNMQAAWNRASATWNDQKRAEFEKDWKEVQSAMQGYLNHSSEYMRFLQGREQAVRKYLGK
jgi:uncharacterized protein YukE